jgi:hypothetical protein
MCLLALFVATVHLVRLMHLWPLVWELALLMPRGSWEAKTICIHWPIEQSRVVVRFCETYSLTQEIRNTDNS